MVLAIVLAVGAMGASDTSARYTALSKQMMCTCGCAQILGECNHVGCPNSPGMLAMLHADLAKGMGDNAVLMAFEQEYGQTVLASPMFTRFNQAAWFVPPAALVLGLLAAMWTVRRWRGSVGALEAAPSAPVPHSGQDEALARVRRETERL